MSLENLKMLSNYVDMVKIKQDTWVVTPTEDTFVHCNLSAYSDFENADLVNIKDFLNKIGLFVETPKDELAYLNGTVKMSADYVELIAEGKKLKYPFSVSENRNHLIENKQNGDMYEVADIILKKLEVFRQKRNFTVRIDAEKYAQLMKLNSLFKSTKNNFSLFSKEGKLYFYTAENNGTDYQLEIGDIPFEDFADFNYSISSIPHNTEWDITFFEGIPLLMWEAPMNEFSLFLTVQPIK